MDAIALRSILKDLYESKARNERSVWCPRLGPRLGQPSTKGVCSLCWLYEYLILTPNWKKNKRGEIEAGIRQMWAWAIPEIPPW